MIVILIILQVHRLTVFRWGVFLRGIHRICRELVGGLRCAPREKINFSEPQKRYFRLSGRIFAQIYFKITEKSKLSCKSLGHGKKLVRTRGFLNTFFYGNHVGYTLPILKRHKIILNVLIFTTQNPGKRAVYGCLFVCCFMLGRIF